MVNSMVSAEGWANSAPNQKQSFVTSTRTSLILIGTVRSHWFSHGQYNTNVNSGAAIKVLFF